MCRMDIKMVMKLIALHVFFCEYWNSADLSAAHHVLFEERLGYVRNPRSLMEGTETLCRDDIGDLPGSPEHLWLRENANEIG